MSGLMSRTRISGFIGLLGMLAFSAIGLGADNTMRIANVMIVDGTGSRGYMGSVRIENGLIVAVGNVTPQANEAVIDGGGLVLAPGFIDTHSHANDELMQMPAAAAAVSQGITTVVIGQDGTSPYPLSSFFARVEKAGVAVNVAAYAGFNTLRHKVLAGDTLRAAGTDELEQLKSKLAAEMQAGALGLSTGLEYKDAIAAPTSEVIEVAKVAAAQGGRYISHLRSEDRALLEALDEIIAVGRATGMPVQISHLKLALRDLWGNADQVVEKLEAARQEGVQITADVYPYEYWQSNMMVIVPSKDVIHRDEFSFALEQLLGPDGFLISRYDPDPTLVGQTLVDIASRRNTSMLDTYQDLAARSTAHAAGGEKSADQIIGTSMTEQDIHALLRWPHTNVCSDGSLADRHPRGRGSFPRVLGRYVREQRVIDLETAVHKMTELPASHMGLSNRGVIRPGAVADLVLFNPDTVIDLATADEPDLQSVGINMVWVGGVQVFQDEQITGSYPGRVLRRQDH